MSDLKYTKRLLWIIGFALLIFVNSGHGQRKVFPVQIVNVTDGDTLRLKFDNDFDFDARLAGIDAPELSQSFGAECKTNLQNLVAGASLRIWILAEDSYGRKIVVLFRDDYSEINLEVVASGCAWLSSVRRNDRERYKAAYAAALSAQLRIWSEPNPCNPAKFRKGKCEVN